MIVKTSELEGVALDWAVAQAAGVRIEIDEDGFLYVNDWRRGDDFLMWTPTEDWGQGGPILEDYLIKLTPWQKDVGVLSEWEATIRSQSGVVRSSGKTPLIAAMRAFVILKVGETVDVPEEMVL